MIKQDFTIGADPEFGFLDTSKYCIEARELIEDENLDNEFGLDGSDYVAELRPKPSKDPLRVISNIGKALREGAMLNPDTMNYDWKAGSSVEGHPIGGHIHFGVGDLDHSCQRQEFLDSLDRYLAQTVILLEDPNEARYRRRSYGYLSDNRDQDWGFEYRTLASWLTSPYIAAGVLCLAKSVVWETLYNGLGSHKEIEINRDAFHDANLTILRQNVDKTWKDIRKFELYQQYQQPIELLYTLISKHRNWFPACGMKTAWAVGKIGIGGRGKLRKTSLNTIWRGVST